MEPMLTVDEAEANPQINLQMRRAQKEARKMNRRIGKLAQQMDTGAAEATDDNYNFSAFYR